MLRIKLIKENNAKLTGIQDYNLKFMSQNRWDTSETGASIMSSFGNDIQVVEELIRRIPQLSNYKIKRAIAGESFGRVFLLDGLDHIFKLFSQSLNPREDIQWYNYCKSRTHSGKGKITTLPVYDTGEIQLKKGMLTYYYVEMARFLTIPEYFNDKSLDMRSPDMKDLKKLQHSFNNTREQYKMYYIDFKREVEELEGKIQSSLYKDELEELSKKLEKAKKNLEWFLKRDGRAIANDLLYPQDEDGNPLPGIKRLIPEFSEDEIKSLIETLHHLIQDGFKFKDVYMKNVGVLEQTVKRSKPTFIIFDN